MVIRTESTINFKDMTRFVRVKLYLSEGKVNLRDLRICTRVQALEKHYS